MTRNSKSTLTIRCVASVPMRPVEWLWKGRMALGKLNLLAGQPGLGKSQITCAFAAAVSTGGAFPDGSIAPNGKVVFLTCEDDIADTIRPRLEAAGADVSKIEIIEAAHDLIGGELKARGVDLSRDVTALGESLKRVGNVRLIVIDPISAFLGKADAHKMHEVRGLLAPLSALAVENNAAILMLSHLNKASSDSNAMSRVNGSGAFVAAARSGWLVDKDPDDEEDRRRLLVPLKNNLGDDSTGFAYSIETVQLTPVIETSRIRFEGPVQMKAADLLQRQASDSEQRTATDDAADFLEMYLDAGPQPQKDVTKAANAEGHSPKSIRRAREKLKVVHRRSGSGKAHASTWELPAASLLPTCAHSCPSGDGARVDDKGTSGRLNGHHVDEAELF